ncbi:hypothetical protein [Salinimonas chungwhensis]|uniref:hypothetical protein n=1 Tax=Salinimonas chungwhensis TaxID=265425 RepID=UPI00037DE0D0|nr:hypothetical protein [Salinimonas chungwhensis]
MDYAYWFKCSYAQYKDITFDDVDNMVQKISAETLVIRDLLKMISFLLIVLPINFYLFYSSFFIQKPVAYWSILTASLLCGAVAARHSEYAVIKHYLKTELLTYRDVKKLINPHDAD